MLQPKRTKYRKQQKGRIKGKSSRNCTLSFGIFGLKTLESSLITDRQIEASRIAATRYMKREGRLWIKIFPDKPITRKPQEVRMGKGKGSVEFWAVPVKSGCILLEISEVTLLIAREALRLAAKKLPVKTKFIVANNFDGLSE